MGALFGEQDGRTLLCELSAIAAYSLADDGFLLPGSAKSTASRVKLIPELPH